MAAAAGVADAWRPATWPHSRRRGASAWPATPSPTEQVERLGRELPLPHLLVPALDAASIGPAETQLLADALAGAVTGLVAEGAR